MTWTRREALAALAGAAAVAGCGPARRLAIGPPESISVPTSADEPNVRFLDRFGYGPRPGDLDLLAERGRDTWIEEQLEAPIDEPPLLTAELRRLDIFHLRPYELRDLPEPEVLKQLQQAAIVRAAASPWQLRERMVDLWSNHFNVFARKGLAAFRKPEDERTVIRANALGNFGEMVSASARSTAMLLYLDQQANHALKPNENYARELLELHTLGVDGGYTQTDVVEVARCFTGWTEERRAFRRKGEFLFRDDWHDMGEKRVLGQTIPAGGGIEDGEQVLSIVARHPSTARHIARKFARHFASQPSDALVAELASDFTRSRGDIKSLVRTLYRSEAWLTDGPMFKRPFDLLISALRRLDVPTTGGSGVQASLAAMGQPLYQWPMPDGYPVEASAWHPALLSRWTFALDLARGRLGDARFDASEFLARFGSGPENLVTTLLGYRSERLAKVVEPFLPEHPDLGVALVLCSPEFQIQ